MTKEKVAWTAADGVSPEQARTGKESSMIEYQETRCHVIFDVKMDFTCKARFVAGGHTTDTPSSITYSSDLLRDRVRLVFRIAGLVNDLDVLAGDVTNAYRNAKRREKIWCSREESKLVKTKEKSELLRVLCMASNHLVPPGERTWRQRCKI